jgi:isoquinoline 1-oxidoreductase alpha subunit
MQAAAFLTENINPTDDEIDVAMRGNLCRCMTYIRVRKAVKLAAEIKSEGKL